jgi:hypothetical protein
MAEILTETSSFDADVVVPQAGDARTAASVKSPIQKLTNRTKYLADHVTTEAERNDNQDAILVTLRTIASYQVKTTVTSGRADLVEVYDRSPIGDFALASNRVEVPAIGTYRVEATIQVHNTDSDNPQLVGYSIYADGTLINNAVASVPAGADGSGLITLTTHGVLVVTTPGSQRVNIVLSANTEVVSAIDSGVGGLLTIQQIVPDI